MVFYLEKYFYSITVWLPPFVYTRIVANVSENWDTGIWLNGPKFLYPLICQWKPSDYWIIVCVLSETKYTYQNIMVSCHFLIIPRNSNLWFSEALSFEALKVLRRRRSMSENNMQPWFSLLPSSFFYWLVVLLCFAACLHYSSERWGGLVSFSFPFSM